MDDDQISAFIDDELNLGEKIQFVESVHANRTFKEETVSLLRQEIRLREPASQFAPVLKQPLPTRRTRPAWLSGHWVRSMGYFSTGLVTALLLAAVFFRFPDLPDPMVEKPQRFVIYQPGVRQAAIIGNFTNWRTLHMQRAGDPGYWEITVDLPPGAYRYSFLLDGSRRMPDPTRAEREQDDFGGVNSILTIDSQDSA
jgi:hypothetical protein